MRTTEGREIPWIWILGGCVTLLMLLLIGELFRWIQSPYHLLCALEAVGTASAVSLIKARQADNLNAGIFLFGMMCTSGFYMVYQNQKVAEVQQQVAPMLQQMQKTLPASRPAIAVPMAPVTKPYWQNVEPLNH